MKPRDGFMCQHARIENTEYLNYATFPIFRYLKVKSVKTKKDHSSPFLFLFLGGHNIDEIEAVRATLCWIDLTSSGHQIQ